MAGARVHHIWRENSNEAFEEIRRLMSKRQGTLYIGMDLEYLADSKTNTKKKGPSHRSSGTVISRTMLTAELLFRLV
jgi:hypothetical protein